LQVFVNIVAPRQKQDYYFDKRHHNRVPTAGKKLHFLIFLREENPKKKMTKARNWQKNTHDT